MEEQIQSTTNSTKPAGKGMTWLWVVIAVIVLIVLFMWFRKPAGDKMEQGISEKETPLPTTVPPSADGISGLDVGDNPDMGVDDFNALPASQEPIN